MLLLCWMVWRLVPGTGRNPGYLSEPVLVCPHPQRPIGCRGGQTRDSMCCATRSVALLDLLRVHPFHIPRKKPGASELHRCLVDTHWLSTGLGADVGWCLTVNPWGHAADISAVCGLPPQRGRDLVEPLRCGGVTRRRGTTSSARQAEVPSKLRWNVLARLRQRERRTYVKSHVSCCARWEPKCPHGAHHTRN